MRIRLNLPRNEQQGCAGAAGLKRDPPLSLSRFHYYLSQDSSTCIPHARRFHYSIQSMPGIHDVIGSTFQGLIV